MSGFDLHEFNILSKRHNYFMTNNRINGFPLLQENSLLLKKILLNRNSNSSDKILNNNNLKPKKFVRFAKPEKIKFKGVYQSPLIFKKKLNNSNDNVHNIRYRNNLNINNNMKNILINSNKKINISPYNKKREIEIGKSLIRPNCYGITFNRNKISYDPDINNRYLRRISNSYMNDSDNDMVVLNFKGKRIFASNSFSGLRNESISNSPDKIDNNSNKASINVGELFRNSEELKKKKEEIFLRKMKRETFAMKKEILKREKDKDIKKEKLSIDINALNNYNNKNNKSNNQNRIRIIPIKKEINNVKKINNSFKIKSLNNDSLNNQTHYTNNIKRIYKFDNNKNTIDITNNLNSYDKRIYLSNSQDNKNKPPYSNHSFKTNNIYFSKYSETSTPKNRNRITVNNRIKENLEYLRLSKNSIEKDPKKEKSISPDRHNNPYQFMTTKKKFVEDNREKESIIYSNDKKISIKVHTLQNINEIFWGKIPTREKLKMQRVISVVFQMNNRNELNYYRARFSRKKKDKISLKSIKEEEEKSKCESGKKLNKEEKSKIETRKKIIEEEKPKLEDRNKLIKEEKPKFEHRFRLKREEKSLLDNKNNLNKKDETNNNKLNKEENNNNKYRHRYKLNKEENSKSETIQKLKKEENSKITSKKINTNENSKNETIKKLNKEEKPKNEIKKVNKEEQPKYKTRYRMLREEKSKNEPKEKLIKTEPKIETNAKNQNPPENNVKRRYWRRFQSKK